MFVTAQGSPRTRFRRAIERRSLINAELAAREMGIVSLEEALELVTLYGELREPRYERAALRYLRRYLEEASPSLTDVALVAAMLTERAPEDSP